MERLLEQSRIVEKTWEDEEVIEKTAVLETLQEKKICTESTENELQGKVMLPERIDRMSLHVMAKPYCPIILLYH